MGDDSYIGTLVNINVYRDAQGNLLATQATAVAAQYQPFVYR
jgi:hypothetical protein